MARSGAAFQRRRPTASGRLLAILPVVAMLAVACAGTEPGVPAGSGSIAAAPSGASGVTSGPAGGAPGSTSVVGTAPGTVPVDPVTSVPVTSMTGGSPKSSAGPSPSSALPAPAPGPGNLIVATETVALVDTSRPTVSRARTIARSRSLPTTVYYPTTGGPWPLLVFAHGFQLGPPGYARIGRALAAAGYVVAAPSFPLADEAVGGSDIDRGDIPQQSKDLSFVIDQLLGNTGGAVLRSRIDGTDIGAVGHSDGADTVLDLGFTPGRIDPRIRAVVALSPDAMVRPGGTGGRAPLLVAHGDRDRVVPYSNATTVYGQVAVHRFLLTLIGADHLPPVTGAEPWTPVLDRTVIEFLDRYVIGQASTDSAIIAAGTVPGVAAMKSAG